MNSAEYKKTVEEISELIMNCNFPFHDIIAAVEKVVIERTLLETAGCRAKAADILGMNRTTMVMKMKKYGYGEFTGARE